MKKVVLTILINVIIVSSIFALETMNGQIKISLDESKGTFSIYKIGSGGERDTSFFLDEDTRTSCIFMLIDNRVYRMGQNSSFTQTASLIDRGIQYIWENPAYKAVLSLTFISSTGGSYSDGVKMSFSVENLTGQSHNIGIRILLDTYQDEDSSVHFLLPTGEIKKEYELKDSYPDWWESGILQVMLNSRGNTPPERVVFANWKRLNENSWFFETRENRNFNLLPYSINDSAVSHYYKIQPLAEGMTRDVSLYMGIKNDIGFKEMTSRQSALASEPIVDVSKGDTYNLLQALEVDLIQVNKVLDELETALANPSGLNATEISELREMVKELEARKSRYSD